MSKREAPHGPPPYKGLKRRCDNCDEPFRVGDMVACLPVYFAAGSKPYELIFCFKGADLTDFVCMRQWLYKYDIKVAELVDDVIFKLYHGKKKNDGGEKSEDPALI